MPSRLRRACRVTVRQHCHGRRRLPVVDFGPVGALMGYDFHVTPSGPKLIQAYTNAGDAFLNAALAQAQRACCAEAELPLELLASQDFDLKIVDMFIDEWRRQRGYGRPTMIAIVDDAPEQQYLFPEFRLAKALLEERDFQTVIADAEELLFEGLDPASWWTCYRPCVQPPGRLRA